MSGSFGAIPNYIMDRRRHYQDLYEARPDPFIRDDLPRLNDESRAAAADLINAPLETVVFVANATEAVNTVLRNIVWNDDGKDIIISFGTIYDACARAEDFVTDVFPEKVDIVEIDLVYPLEDDEILAIFRDEVTKLEAAGKRARLALFDVVSSNPGLVFPWEAMVAACRDLDVISLVDGAQGIGMVPLDVSAANPDFFVTNCHKWLHVPRACAVFHVPVRNQHLLPSTLATARGYTPKHPGRGKRTQPLPDGDGKNHFVRNFEWVGTRDDSAYLCVKDAIAWRRDVLGGEERIMAYLWDLNKRGIAAVAATLGTSFLENRAGTLTDCAMANVALPIWVGDKGREQAGPGDTVLATGGEANDAFNWMQGTLVDEYKTFMAVFYRWDRFWVRISAQVYLDMGDYEWAGRTLKVLCERVAKGEFRK